MFITLLDTFGWEHVALIILAVAAVAVLLYLIPEIIKYAKVTALNSKNNRDKRFASRLLSIYFKNNVIENPYLLRTDSECRPNADLLVVCEGGIVIISVEDRNAFFETPKKGVWTMRSDEEVVRIPNLFERGSNYVKACANIARRNAISCPIFNLVLISGENAEYDQATSEGIITNDILVSCIKSIKRKQKISSEEVKLLTELICQNDSYCRKLFVGSTYNNEVSEEKAAGKAKSTLAPDVEDSYDVELGEDEDTEN